MQELFNSTNARDIMYTLAGYPVKVNYELQPIAEGNVVALFGNPNNYAVRTLRNVTVKRDDYSSMNIDAVNFYATMRVDGKVINPNTCFAKMTVQPTP